MKTTTWLRVFAASVLSLVWSATNGQAVTSIPAQRLTPAKTIAAVDEPMKGYLFVYFTGNAQSQEQIHFAISRDGLHYFTLNGGNPVIPSDKIAEKRAVRDPHILRAQDGKTFYMVVTDMKSSDGWSSNRGLVMLKSTDLVNWTASAINISTTFAKYSDVLRVWAPETIYDPVAQKYMLYFSMRQPTPDRDIIYYAYANKDFTSISEPKVLYDRGKPTIDGNMVFKDGTYHLFFKTEGEDETPKGIKKVTSTSATGPWTLNNQYLDQNASGVEGPAVFQLIDSDTYILMYDVYGSGYYEFCSSTDLTNFSVVKDISMDFTPRHGTVIPITMSEEGALLQKWGASFVSLRGARNPYINQKAMKIDNTSRTIFLPLTSGADVGALDPQFYSWNDSVMTISPSGPQNFTLGSVSYTVSMDGQASKTYTVTAELANNPVINGNYAEPELMLSHSDGKYYMYPTTDGIADGASTAFKVFSSTDMLNWAEEGTALDLADVSWAESYAWAPSVVEKRVNGEYKYYFYYCADKKIGVAVSNSPKGPFVDSGSPLITINPSSVTTGAPLYPDVFTDPLSGKSYIYWGQRYLAVAELNEDMVSLKEGSTQVITPSAGAFKEGVEVFFREGKYYFVWSRGTSSSNLYRTVYGMSDSPVGPITVPVGYSILSGDATKGIISPGQASVVQIPEKDEWYIAYNRFAIPNGALYSREVCMDSLVFSADTILAVRPSRSGIQPVSYHITGEQPNVLPLEGEIVSSNYYRLDGVYAGNAFSALKAGLYIRKDLYDDGRSSVCKVLIVESQTN